ncbi:hypothetical protein BJV82DRAFT_192756 [Fennellomyces sp. T-0311]|nr:hypothetical protein BJV82DRAFT_192756 [Fennellomyces sp. T-0311]
MILDREELRADRSKIGQIMSANIAEYSALSDEELQALQEDADLVNLQRSLNGPNFTNSLRAIYRHLYKSLDRNFNMLKQMCGLDAICFVVPKKLGGYMPKIFLHGSDRALPFYALMEKDEVLITGRTMVERFKMYCYEQTEKEGWNLFSLYMLRKLITFLQKKKKQELLPTFRCPLLHSSRLFLRQRLPWFLFPFPRAKEVTWRKNGILRTRFLRG